VIHTDWTKLFELIHDAVVESIRGRGGIFNRAIGSIGPRSRTVKILSPHLVSCALCLQGRS